MKISSLKNETIKVFLPHPRVHHTSAPHEAFRPMPLRRIDRGRPPEQTNTLFTGVVRVYDSKRLWRNERGGKERDCGAKREVARQQPASATRETAARQDSWRSDNQPAQVRCNKRGGGAKRERWRSNERGAGTTREALARRER